MARVWWRTVAARGAVLAVAALVGSAGLARAQVGLVKLEVAPWVGAYVPATDLVKEEAGVPAPLSITTSVAFGANLGVRLPLGIAIEGQVGYAPAEVEGGGLSQPQDLNALFASANLQWRFGPPLIPVKPYVVGGLGLVRWESDAFSSQGAGESVTNLAGSVGAGAYVTLGPIVSLRADGRAYLTSFNSQDFGLAADESAFQSHFVLSAGLVFGFGI